MRLYLLICSLSCFLHTYSHVRNAKGKDYIQDYTCTAVWVAPDKLLTAGHCISEATGQKWILDWEVEHLQVKVIGHDYAEDLALLQTVKPMNHVYAHLGRRGRPTERVFMTSFEDEMAYVYGRGEIIGQWVNEDLSEHPFLANNIIAVGGSSGGGWFNENGEIIGVQVMTDKLGSFAVDQPTVKAFLEDNGIR